MSVGGALDAGIKRFAALRSGRLAVYGIDGARLRRFVAEVVPVAEQVVPIGRKTRTARTVCVGGTGLSHTRAAGAHSLSTAPAVIVVIGALPENIARGRAAEVRGQVAVRAGSAGSAGLQGIR